MTSGDSSANPAALLRAGRYVELLCSDGAKNLIAQFVQRSSQPAEAATQRGDAKPLQDTQTAVVVGLAAFNAFLQANVTGPVLEGAQKLENVFVAALKDSDLPGDQGFKSLRKECFAELDVDGVSVYPYIPHIELFALARWVVLSHLDGKTGGIVEDDIDVAARDVRWLVLRVLVWHFKLLSQPSLGSGSVFVKGGQWSDVPALQEGIEKALAVVEGVVMNGEEWDAKEKVQFLVEKANICVMLGQDVRAREALRAARERSGFVYALSGALGKRTRFQEKSTSHLVVLAKSGGKVEEVGEAKPEALKLNDDTLLETLEFTKEEKADGPEHSWKEMRDVPDELKDLEVDDQPQLAALDQIILLTEATLKDAFSPTDTLTSEEILPFAVRVISDKSTNWQVYTQALLVRSRIEVHRSRTVERGVLQMQAVVDQVVVETTADEKTTTEPEEAESDVPVIRVNDEEARPVVNKPTSFFPAAKPTETAPAQVRLQYIHALSSPPRWHLESELAYSWASVGSLVSALEIFKRLRLWAEVALCLAGAAQNEDEDGRGSGGEEKAKAILRWRLFRRTDAAAGQDKDDVDEDVHINELKEADYKGPERSPAPPGAPRMFCILGDIENDPAYYERAWEISKNRFFRAQKSLGEWYLQQKNLEKAKEAYEKAIAVNRMSSELWNRLGDISLRLGQFSDASDAFGRAIASADNIVGGEDARTWSNLGSALYSLYLERVKELKAKKDRGEIEPEKETSDNLDDEPTEKPSKERDPATLLSQALAAYKRGASISHDNWRIWDNVITLGSRLRPPAVSDILLALRNVIRIRNTEEALDVNILRILLNESVLSKQKTDGGSGVYEPPRGTNERAVCDLIETLIVPLITVRSELWELVTRERVWRRDFAGAIDAAERAWRAAIGSAAAGGGGLLPSSGTNGHKKSWLEDKGEWKIVVQRTDELVSVWENYGEEIPDIGPKWKGKARSAVRSVLGKAKENWEGSEEWGALQSLLEGLKL